jgi:probable rRNA maturation factor
MPDPGDSRSAEPPLSLEDDWLAVSVVHDDGNWPDLAGVEALILAAVRALARHPDVRRHRAAEACIALSSDAAVRKLNAAYRQKDAPTNVLSFPAPGGFSIEESIQALGDIVIAHETVMREAQQQNIPFSHHLQHLAAHGLLHLLGYDHESTADAEVMERLEIEVLASLGIADPYTEALLSLPAVAARAGA